MNVENELATRIAGEIVLSKEPGRTIKKWREIFRLSQKELAGILGMSVSVISDYENGRRKSPGAAMIRKIVEALIEFDIKNGGEVLRRFEKISKGRKDDAILDIRDFLTPLRCKDIVKILECEVVANSELLDRYIYGYTVIDSLKAILEMKSDEFIKLYGLTSQRAIVFTKVKIGRSPFIAIKVAPIKPAFVILNKPKSVDKLGIEIAKRERIPVAVTRLSIKDIITRLRGV